MSKRRKVVILFGGKSVEHDISIRSATNIFQYINQEIFEVILVGIDRNGNWHLCPDTTTPIEQGDPVALALKGKNAGFLNLSTNQSIQDLDAVFPVLHGTDGEDGSIQGLLKTVSLPCVGSGVLGSSVSMDKLMTKKLLQQAGIPTSKYLNFSFLEKDQITYDIISRKLGLPFMIKPARLGSSVGVKKVKSEDEFEVALADAFQFDNQIILESYVQGREFECAVMGNEDPKASVPGEVILNSEYEFYSFEAKYVDPDAAKIQIPAQLDQPTIERVRELAVASYKALACEDYARVDLFVGNEGEVLINEINTIPGFTNISMFPKLWEHAGIKYSDLITQLIDFAISRNQKLERITTKFDSNLEDL